MRFLQGPGAVSHQQASLGIYRGLLVTTIGTYHPVQGIKYSPASSALPPFQFHRRGFWPRCIRQCCVSSNPRYNSCPDYKNRTISASDTKEPNSLRSYSMGRLFSHSSVTRLSWPRQSTGTANSFAIIFSIRDVSAANCRRFSAHRLRIIRCK